MFFLGIILKNWTYSLQQKENSKPYNEGLSLSFAYTNQY